MKRTMERIVSLGLLVTMLAIGARPAAAQAEGAYTDRVVAAGDWLARIASSEIGDWALYPAIVGLTNRLAEMDPSYATIVDPNRIEPGWKLAIPGRDAAKADVSISGLRNATYVSEWAKEGVAALVDGLYSEEIVPGSASKLVVSLLPNMAFGTAPGGETFAAVILATNSGGSGTFVELAIVILRDGKLTHIVSEALGDRVRIDSLGVDDQQIIVAMTKHGPDDAMCCPSQDVVARYRLDGDELVSLGEASADALQSVTWQWSATEGGDAPTSIADRDRYTIVFDADGAVHLKADCNVGAGKYVLDGDHLSLVEPFALTRAMCPSDSLDTRFLDELGQIERYTVSYGALQLILANGATMSFVPAI